MNLIDLHSTILRQHINYFPNNVKINAGKTGEYSIDVIFNDISKLIAMRGISDVLDEVASIYIDKKTLFEMGKTIKENDTVTGKPSKYEDEATYYISDIYEDKHLPCYVCELKTKETAVFETTTL